MRPFAPLADGFANFQSIGYLWTVMSDQTEFQFVPEGKLPTVTSIWLPALYLLMFFSLLTLITGKPLGIIVVCMLFVALLTSFGEYSLELRVSVEHKTLEYIYLNALGQERRRVVNIPNAKGRYKYTKTGRASHAWQLSLSSGRDSIKINARTKRGFSKEQLDEIAKLIDLCKKGD